MIDDKRFISKFQDCWRCSGRYFGTLGPFGVCDKYNLGGEGVGRRFRHKGTRILPLSQFSPGEPPQERVDTNNLRTTIHSVSFLGSTEGGRLALSLFAFRAAGLFLPLFPVLAQARAFSEINTEYGRKKKSFKHQHFVWRSARSRR
jgi:hypothetical protein